ASGAADLNRSPDFRCGESLERAKVPEESCGFLASGAAQPSDHESETLMATESHRPEVGPLKTPTPSRHEFANLHRLEQFSLGELEAVRLILRGGSVIDWGRLNFETHEQVDRFLSVNEFNPHSRSDIERLEHLRRQAVEFLLRNFRFKVPREVSHAV